jgi:hypothetical protein
VPITVNTKRNWTPPAPTGGAQCCQNVQNSSSVSSAVAGIIKGLLGINISGLNIPIGTGCVPVGILGGVSCNTNTVQCGDVDQSEWFSRELFRHFVTIACSLAYRYQLRPDHRQRLIASWAMQQSVHQPSAILSSNVVNLLSAPIISFLDHARFSIMGH